MNNIEDNDIYGCSDGIRYSPVDESMFPDILQHIREYFSADEILGKSLGVTEALTDDICDFAKKNLAAGKDHSIVALDESTGEIAGVFISKVAIKSEHHHDSKVYGPDFTKILDIMDYLESQSDVFEKYGVDRCFDISIASVSTKYRGKRIASHLVSRSLRAAKSKGFKLAKGTFTSLYSQRIAHKMGFQVEAEVLYKDYVVDGQVVFSNTEEHPSAQWMVKIM